MHCLPQNCKERAVPNVVRFVELLSEGIRATNRPGYIRSKHNFVVIQADHNQGAHGEISGLSNICSTKRTKIKGSLILNNCYKYTINEILSLFTHIVQFVHHLYFRQIIKLFECGDAKAQTKVI